MLTNIIATITVAVVTNVSEQVIQPPVTAFYYGCAVANCPVDHYKEAQEKAFASREKVRTTNVIERTVVTFDWQGPREVVTDKTISSLSVTQRMEWR